MICSVVLTAGTQAGDTRRWPSLAGFSGAAAPQHGPTHSRVQNTAKKPRNKLLSRRRPRKFVGNGHDAKAILPNRRQP
jgi:hypothetical protein